MSRLYRWKPEKDRALAPVCRRLAWAGVTPDTVTATGLLVSAVAGVIAASGQLSAGVVVFVIGAGLDALDGSLARTSGCVTETGLYLDSVADRCSEAVFVVGAILGGVTPVAIAVVAGSVVLLASRVHNHRRGLDSDAAVTGRPERLALLIVGVLAPYPANAFLFLVDGVLCVISSGLVLASGTRIPPGRE